MSGLVIGLIVGGAGLVVALIWALVDNLFVYKRKASPGDGSKTKSESNADGP